MSNASQGALSTEDGPPTPQQAERCGFHLAPIPLAPGSIILPGNWGRIIKLRGQDHPAYQREKMLEDIRSAEFPNKPSRLSATFMCPNFEAASWMYQFHCPSNLIYWVCPTDDAASYHVGHVNCLPSNEGDIENQKEMARHYWNTDLAVTVEGHGGYSPLEVVVASSLRILQHIPHSVE